MDGFSFVRVQFFFFYLATACGILVLRPGLTPAVEAQNPNHWTARELPLGAVFFFFNFLNWSIVGLQCWVNYCYTAKWFSYTHIWGFPDSSVGKNLPAIQETPVWFLGQEDVLERGFGYSLQYSWAFLVAQLVKNPLAMRETWVRSLGWEDPLEKGKATNPVTFTFIFQTRTKSESHRVFCRLQFGFISNPTELILSNCGPGGDSWESLVQQGNQTSQF